MSKYILVPLEPVAWIIRHPRFCGKFTDDKEIAEHWENKEQGCTAPLYTAPQPAEQQPAADVAGLIICDECHAKCSEPYTGLFASHCPDEEPCIMCECSSLRRQLASRSGVPVEPDVAALVEALGLARIDLKEWLESFPNAPREPTGKIIERIDTALAAQRKQGGAA